MKIAILTETFLPQINGVVRTVEKIVTYLEQQGHEALLIAIGEGPELYSKTKIVRVPGIEVSVYKELSLVKPEKEWFAKLLTNDIAQLPIAALQSLVPTKNTVVGKALQEFQPELIHLVTPVTLGAIGQFYIDKWKLPSIATFHTDLAAYAPRYQIPYAENMVNIVTNMIYGRADRVLAPSPSSKEQLENIGLKSVGVFGRGVDQELFNPVKADKQILAKHGLDPNKVTVMYAGRLAEEKSIDKLVRFFKKISDRTSAQLLLVGDGPIRAELEQELQGTCHAFTGFQTGEDYATLHATADIFAFPSVTETFGQVVLEAMASGSAIIGYESPGVKDLIVHDHSGLLAKTENDDMDTVASFENYLLELCNDIERAKLYGKHALTEARQRSWEKILADFVSEYEALIKSHHEKLMKKTWSLD